MTRQQDLYSETTSDDDESLDNNDNADEESVA